MRSFLFSGLLAAVGACQPFHPLVLDLRRGCEPGERPAPGAPDEPRNPSGNKMRILLGDCPMVLESPEGDFIAAGALDLRNPDSLNGLEIWRAGPGGLEASLVLDGGREWGAAALRWEGPLRLHFPRVSAVAPASGMPPDTVAMTATREGASWRVEETGR